MPALQFTEVLTFSSEDPNHPAENLLRPDTFRKWKCASGTTEKQSSVTLKLEKLSSIHSIDIGNEGSAFVEVLAGREGVAAFQVLLVASSFMSPIESRNSSDMNRVRMFGPDRLNKNVAGQKWDRLKIICTQPFNKQLQYGLSFITVRSPGSDSSSSSPPAKITKLGSFTLREDGDNDPISIGSAFARRKDKEPSSPISGAAAIRAASSAAAASGSSPGMQKRKAEDPPPDVGFYQLKKKAVPDQDPVKTPTGSKPAHPPSVSSSHKKDQINVRDKDRHESDKRKNGKKEVKHRSFETVEKEVKENRNKNANNKTETKNGKASSSKPSASASSAVNRKSKPFSSLMDDVIFVMSGYQNPQRSQLRDMMLDMGAKYKGDWEPKCTHLICAFINTPKYQQVKGRGRIVSAKWISDCHKNKIRYPCKRYALEKGHDQTESEDEIWALELLPKDSKPATDPPASASVSVQDENDYNDDIDTSDNEDTDDEIERVLARQKKTEDELTSRKTNSSNSTRSDTDAKVKEKNNKSTPKLNERKDKEVPLSQAKKSKIVKVDENATKSNGTAVSSDDEVYDDDTDVDEENIKYLKPPDTSALPLPTIGEYLKGKCLFVHGKMAEEKKKLLQRYIIAFNGDLADYMSDKVQFVITEDTWDENFDEALNENSSLQFVKPLWIWRCCDKQKLVPHQPYLIVPTE
ncbi:DNA repair protein XRCC1 [Procambarus clarkii]|uniref:DNA repair protein XRCC1 n=1 Tax=Procambarus clarkii TaxID=6728 RepID=UPI0037426AFD